MPHNPKAKTHKKPAEVLKGETPRSEFADSLDSVKVDLIYYPDSKIDLTAYAFQKATWMTDPYIPNKDKKRDKEILKDLKIHAFEKKGLPLSLELYDFVFCVSGITRLVTHQIVRNRIGATYSQQCSGDKDWRHHRVLVPRSIYKDKKVYEKFRSQVLENKKLYADMLDTMEIPVLDARRILPHCLETFIYVKFNLVTLATFIPKRDCVQTQEPEMVMVARRMREAVLKKFPNIEPMLRNKCKDGKCFYTLSDRQVGTSMFVPDKDHDFDYNKNNFFYDKTVRQMVYDLPKVPTEYYIGAEKVTKKSFLK
ncbi:FAD-dependent thymidylate synthase [Candidatus Microgenomates bacterium]|nr:MAG: FAD-dependent thymidylate synthase [Candidatus Microgenomates bacterium]